MKKRYKCVIIGHFGGEKESFDGQTIKTINVSEELEKAVGDDNVLKIDTHGHFIHFLSLILKAVFSLNKANDIVFLLANRGIQILVPILLFFNKYKKRKLHYIVIGGWLPALCKQRPSFAGKLKKIYRIYVETNSMKGELESLGFNNILVMPNFKKLKPLHKDLLVYQQNEPLSVCTFSRVMKEKGIEDIVEVIRCINEKNGRVIYKLDIFGKIDNKQVDWFTQLKSSFPSYIEYKGCISSDKTTDVVKNYYALIFPTRFYTEGLPGTILDAYFAGVPVISSRWANFDDLIDEGKTGLGYKFEDESALYSILDLCAKDLNILNGMKLNCLERAITYSGENAIKIIDFVKE